MLLYVVFLECCLVNWILKGFIQKFVNTNHTRYALFWNFPASSCLLVLCDHWTKLFLRKNNRQSYFSRPAKSNFTSTLLIAYVYRNHSGNAMFDFTVKYKSNHQELHHWCFWDNIPKLLEGILKKRNMIEQDQKPKKGRKKVFHWIEILSLNLIAISIKAIYFGMPYPFYLLHLHFFNTFINISILHSQHDFSAHPFIDSSLQSYHAMQYI